MTSIFNCFPQIPAPRGGQSLRSPVWRCDDTVSACNSRDCGAVLVRDARKMTGKRARDAAIASRALQNLRKVGKSFARVRRSLAARLGERKD